MVRRSTIGIVYILALIRWPCGPNLAVALEGSIVPTPPGGFEIYGRGEGGDQGDDGDFGEHYVWRIVCFFFILKVGQRRLLLNGLEVRNWPYFILIYMKPAVKRKNSLNQSNH